MRGRHDRIRRQAVDLRLVEQQEEGTEAADAVVRVAPIQAGAVPPLSPQLLEAPVGSRTELLDLAELDRVGWARLRARRLVAALQTVVAERALPHAAVLVLAQERQRRRRVVGRA